MTSDSHQDREFPQRLQQDFQESQEDMMRTNLGEALGAHTQRADRERGAMLIVALAVLALLSIIAVTFAALMRLERRATENFSNTIRAEMIAGSAESTLISMMRGGYYWHGFTDVREGYSPWLYREDSGELAYGGVRSLDEVEPKDSSLSGSMGSLRRGDPATGYFKTKVIDTSAQININGLQDNLAEMLDNLGLALRADPRYENNPMFSAPNEGGRRITGESILRYRNTLEGNEFETKSQLRNIIGEVNYNQIADFITTKSWVDGSTYRSGDGVARYTVAQDQSGSSTFNDPNREGLRTEVVGSARLSPEPRAPININTAPRPVLIAVLMGLAGRRAFPLVQVNHDDIMGKNRSEIDLENGSLPPGSEELFLKPAPVWVYTKPFEIDNATRIADAIIARRKSSPFKVWSNALPGQSVGGFNEFVNSLPEGVFPAPTTITVVNPVDVRGSSRYRNALISGSGDFQDSNQMFRKGHPTVENSFRGAKGMSKSSQWAWYYDTVRGVLKANFNPNTRINKYNPNATAYAEVDKFGLVKLSGSGNNAAQSTPVPGHTTEFCFDTNGIFEITTVAEVALPNLEQALTPGDRISKIKRRSIVKVFEVLRHTTQEDFEQPFRVGPFSSAISREFVSTFPDPMSALHRELYYGSREDGRVELAGYLDALREEQTSNQRAQYYQGRSGFLLHHGFRFRNDRSLSQLRQLTQRGGDRRGDEFIKELNSVLDPEFVRGSSNLRKRYSRHNWGALDSEEEGASIDDLVVDTVASGSDLYPDGINTSLQRRSALGQGFLRFPASVYRATPGDPGEMLGNYSNDTGNLPYYQGGVAFWIKPEFDGNDPVFSGLIGATQVQFKVGAANLQDSEGSQFYVWKNTKGQLRISRLYYHQAFQKNNTALAVPIFPEAEDDDVDDEEIEAVLDDRKFYARSDVVVDISNWRANEWHHLAISYNDEIGGSNRIKVFVDFQDVSAVSHNLGEGEFVALNVEEPKDSLFVGGFYRDQAVEDEGLFKFGTNFSRNDGSQRAASIKRVQANATIDEFVTFTGNYVGPFGAIGYFTDKRGRYTNRFEVPFPEGIQRVKLRSITWTVLPPTRYNGQQVRFPEQNVSFQVANLGTQGFTLQGLQDAGGDARRNTSFAGNWLYAGGGNREGKIGELVYQVAMRGALGSGDFGARVVASPVLEDVTLTYYLPSAQTLLTESLE